jgi:hypothetical protein
MADGQWGGLQTVVLAKAVTAAVDDACAVYPRFEEAWDALIWLLSRNASVIGRPHTTDPSLRLYVQADDLLAGVPSIWIVYRVGVEVEILAANIVAPVADEEDE